DVQLAIDGSIKAEQGPLEAKSMSPLHLRTYGPLKLSAARFCAMGDRCTHGPLVIFTSNEIELSTLRERFTVTPAVELDWDAASVAGGDIDSIGPHVSIPGAWKPGTQYSVTIAKGVADVFKQVEVEGLTATVATHDLSPSLIFGSGLGLLEVSDSTPKLPVEVANLKALDVQLWKLSVPELVAALARPPYEAGKGVTRAPDFRVRQGLEYPRNTARVHPIDLSKVLGTSKTGVALALINSPDLEYRSDGYRQLVQVTDLAAHVKIGPKQSLAWVTRLSNGQPVADADVTLYDEKAASLWTGKTNAEGFADIPGTVALKLKNPEYRWQFPFALVVAQKDGDLSATANTWADGVEPYEFNLSQGWESEEPQSTGFVFTDRGIYRPGDTVNVKGVVRYRVVGELRAPSEGSQLSLKITSPSGETVKQETVKVSAYGTFSTSVVISADSPTGYFSIAAEGDIAQGTVAVRGSFSVAEYRAPQFRVDVESKAKSVVAGEALQANVLARYLFGGAMANSPVKWSMHREVTSFSPEAARDFIFTQETWWWNDAEPEPTGGFFSSGEGMVDAKGVLAVNAGVAEAQGAKPYTYTLEAEVTDVNRQSVAGRADVTVHPAAFYVGLKSNSAFLQVGTSYPLEAIVVTPDGARTAGRAFEVSVTSRTWKSVKKKDASGGFSTISEPVETEVAKCPLTSGATSVTCPFTPKSAGFLIVRGTVKDDAGRVHTSSFGLYATGSDWVAWQRNDTDRLELITDKTLYDVGDVAKVLIKSPYPEAKALVTVEREGVLQRRLVDLKGSVVTIDVPVTEEMVPNMYVGVLIMRPRVAVGGIETGDDPGRPNARIGFTKLNVEKKTKRLSVAVKTAKPTYQPRDVVPVTVEVKDAAGTPVDGEATLYVVDEAVLRLTAYETPDPIAEIFTERPLSTRLGEPLLHLVRRRSYGEKGEVAGGGGGKEGVTMRTNFKTTALWLPAVSVKNGVAQTTLTLPDNLTTFRIMAVVVTKSDRFGSGDASIQVNKPVMALPALPRFARVGDAFEAGVVVHVHGAGAGEVTVSATVEGGAELKGPAEKKVSIAEGTPAEVRFSFAATARGPATFRFKAIKGSDTDGVEHVLPVELPVEMDAVATYGDTTDTRVEGLVTPQNVHDDLGGLTVSMSSTVLSQFGQGFQQLIEYPYGCLEQQSSRLVPFIALREISGQFGVPWPKRDAKKAAIDDEHNAFWRTYLFPTLDVSKLTHPDDVIATTVKSISSLQNGDGSFRYWADSWCSSSWASAYATLALGRAKEVGFAVPADTMNRATAYLEKVVGGSCSRCEYGCSDETRVLAAYVLARNKKPKASSYPELYARRKDLSLFGRALLANAMFVGGGDRKQANALLQEILNQAKESAKGVHLEEVKSGSYATYFHSDTRTTGVVLQALTDIAPDHPYVAKMARYLTGVRQGNGEWRSTQEAAFSLLGLTQVLRTKEKDTPDFMAKVALGAAELLAQPFKGRSMDPKQSTVPMKDLLGKPDGKLTFSKEGPGVLYYSALLKYAPKELPTKPLDNGLTVQRWFEPYAGGGQATRFFAGDLVRIRVRVATNQERHWAAFEVPLPAGLEPIDTSLATTARFGRTPGEESRGIEGEGEGEGEYEDGSAEGDGPASPWAYGFWSPFNHTEVRDNRVVVFADHLPPGV
ncbi:MAG: alpha-2-macroglobulin, partial [Archangium sp.]|nr:alpha-2-macroglobulin [Archangium sp.]